MKKIFIPLFLLIFFMSPLVITALAQHEATVVLKNTKRIDGKIIEDVADYLVIVSDLGEVKIPRADIERVLYDIEELKDTEAIEAFKDHVIVHMQDGDVFDGILIAKGSTALIVKTELGRMTVPKQDIKVVEYVSKAYAERGEPVRVKLQNGQDLDGYLYHEDRNSLTLTTKTGRLTLEKENLRSISYNVPVTFTRSGSQQDQYTATSLEDPYQVAPLRKRQDTFEFGYSSQFGENYASGGSFMYKKRFLLKDFNSFSFNLEGDLGFAGFSLNQNVLDDRAIPGAVSASGGAVVTTLGIGSPLHFFPSENAPYEFFITPIFETHLVYNSLTKEYPSFPTLNSEERDTNIRYGIGTQIGLEWAIARKWKVGISWNSHFLFGDSDFSTIALHVGTRLF